MMKKSLMFIALVFFVSGCSLYHVTSEDATDDYYPSKATANEVVYIENIDRAYEVIGYVTVNTERRQRISEVIEKMRREAAIIGGDVITNIRSDATGAWKQLPVQEVIGNGYVRANFKASVAVFK